MQKRDTNTWLMDAVLNRKGDIMGLDCTALGKRIQMLRISKGLSQEELCNRLHCTQPNLSYIETGKKCAALDTFISIANILDVSADDLLMESINHSRDSKDSYLLDLVSDCNDEEMSIIIQTVLSLKKALRSK